ncbi:MAG: hypothetical protein FMNOHCHN_00331 [Ignavibacteriaceae bacterium]|nr:hypothetical protein [Ignavibacteriaceae bacterium]
MPLTSFTEIESWKESRELVKEIYQLTDEGRMKVDFGYRDQLRRAGVSIMSNIAEGFDSGSNKSFINFLNYAYRSASEVESLIFVGVDVGYISTEKFKELLNRTDKIKKLIGGFIKYLKTKN